jgi:pilus assembly protein CpaB
MKPAQIAVLALALGAGGLAAIFASRIERSPDPPPAAPRIATVEILVAKTDIEAGLKLTPDKVEWREWPETAIISEYIRKTDSAAATEIAASIARTPFNPGEPILKTKLIGPNGSGYMAALLRRGMRAVSTEIRTPDAGVAGFILPNDRVDVILTPNPNNKTGPARDEGSETILANVRVLAIDQTAEEKNGQKVIIGKTATLEVTEIQAETLALARTLGTISLALRSYRDASIDDNGFVTDILSAAENITIVRGPNFDVQLQPLSKRRMQSTGFDARTSPTGSSRVE